MSKTPSVCSCISSRCPLCLSIMPILASWDRAEVSHLGCLSHAPSLWVCGSLMCRLGGLWVTLPPWQTVQNDPRDFCMQGFTTNKRVWYPGDVCHMLEEYVRVQQLEPYICLGREVLSQEWVEPEEAWLLKVRACSRGGAEWSRTSCREADLSDICGSCRCGGHMRTGRRAWRSTGARSSCSAPASTPRPRCRPSRAMMAACPYGTRAR